MELESSLFTLGCTGLLCVVVFGISCFYSGLTQRRLLLLMFAVPMVMAPFIILDWFIWGYSLAYSPLSNRYIGNMGFVVLRHGNDIYTTPQGEVWSLLHFLFTGMFKVVCAALAFPGAIAERGRLLPMLVFIFFWSCIVYNPVTYWFWSPHGWLSPTSNLPVLDYAGGNCIHIVTGFTALAYSYSLGPRNPRSLHNYRSLSTGMVVIGAYLICVGWTGFIAGCGTWSEQTPYVIIGTVLSACTLAVVWTLIDYYFSLVPLDEGRTGGFSMLSPRPLRQNKDETTRKVSLVSFSLGLVAGLVIFTPGGGYVPEVWKPIVYGVIAGVVCNVLTRLKYMMLIDDALDIFAIHGVAGITGLLLTGFFASERGWVAHHWVQFGYQVLGCVVTAAYVFVVSCVFLYLIDFVPGLHLRIDKGFNRGDDKEEEYELEGQDHYEYGEYLHDGVEFTRAF